MKLAPAISNDTLLSAHEVTRLFGAHRALDHVSLTVREGDIITVIGLNGSGKTTLLKVLLGLEPIDAGQIYKKPGLRIGYMPQRLQLDKILPLTVRWFLELYASGKARAENVMQLCGELNITHLLKQEVHNLSGGELQRVMLARALLSNPELLVLDEPAQGVDVNGQAELYALITKAAKQRGCAVLMVSHDIHLVMASTHHVICLNHHICCSGLPGQVSRDPEFAALFGTKLAESLAVYVHHHDHHHDMHGEVVQNDG